MILSCNSHNKYITTGSAPSRRYADGLCRHNFAVCDPNTERTESPPRREKPELSIDLDRGLGGAQHRHRKLYGEELFLSTSAVAKRALHRLFYRCSLFSAAGSSSVVFPRRPSSWGSSYLEEPGEPVEQVTGGGYLRL